MIRKHITLLFILCATTSIITFGQVVNNPSQRIDSLSKHVSGLNNPITLSVSNANLGEFLRAISITNNVNLSADDGINNHVTANFNNEPFKNVLTYCIDKYRLEVEIYGTIIALKPYSPPKAQARPINITVQDSLVSLDINGRKLSKVLKKLSGLTGQPILKTPKAKDPLITLFLQGVSLEDVLSSLAQTHDLVYRKNENNYHLIDGKSMSGSSIAFNPGNFKFDHRTDSIGNQLLSIEAYDIPVTKLIKTVNQRLGINYFLYAEPTGAITIQMADVPYLDLMRFLLDGSAFSFKVENNVFLVGEKAAENVTQTKVVALEHRRSETIIESIPDHIKNEVQLHHFPELNSIVISGNSASIMEVEGLINSLDRVVPMVLIEVMVVEVSKNSTISTGITAGIGDSTITSGGKILPGIDFNLSSASINQFLRYLENSGVVNLGQVDQNFYVSLKLLEERGDIDIQSTPKLSALNSHPASMKIGETRFYRIETQNVIGAQNPQLITTNQFNQVEANLAIDITPTVSVDEQVTMNINVEFSSFLGAPTNTAPPDIATRQFQSMIRVKNQEMVILGGLEEVENSQSSSGIPVLSRIPILKWIFSQRTKTKNKGKLLIFIKPTIIE